MKKWLTFILLILLIGVAVWCGVQIQQQPGYLLIAFRQWTLETPLWVGALALLITILGAYIIFRLVAIAFNMPKKWRQWQRHRHQQQASQYTLLGLRQLIEGNWQIAERKLNKAQRVYPQVWLNDVAAAIAAHHQAAFDRRDVYLQKARQTDPQATLAIDLVQARLYIQQQRWSEAAYILQLLREETPRHPEILRLLAQVYAAQHNWTQLNFLLPELQRYDLLSDLEIQQLARNTYGGLLTHAMLSHSPATVAMVWQEIPKPFRKDVLLLNSYADFLSQHQPAQAEQLLREALKQEWHSEWVRRYGAVQGENNAKQLALAEGWLKDHPNDPDLLFCLGQLCVRQRLWGKARHYFETCLAIKPSSQVYYEFAKLLEQMDENPAALHCYRQGLALDSSVTPFVSL
jgi:HemY protein